MSMRNWCKEAAVVAVVGITGCQHNTMVSRDVRGEEFRPDTEPHAVQNIMAAQTAAGARADATLHAADFDSGQLNSLGQQKLDLMMSGGRPSEGMVVYLDLAPSALTPQVRSSVMDYLSAHGVAGSQMRLEDGANPATRRPAEDAIQELISQQGLPGQQGGQMNVPPSAGSAGTISPTSAER